MFSPHARYSVTACAVAAFLFSGNASAATSPAARAPEYQVVDQWKIGGLGSWDFLTFDGARHRLFVTRGDHVDVVDTSNGNRLARLEGTKGVHGVALAPDLRRGFASDGKGNAITEFDLDSLAVVREVAIPAVNPDAILYSPRNKWLYVFNGKSQDALILDATTLAVVAKIPMPGKPEVAQDDGHGHVFVNIESEPGQIVRINAATLSIDATWTLPGCNSPTGLALDTKHSRLFSTCDDKVMAVTDAQSGRQVARIVIGNEPDSAGFDSERGIVFSSNGDGTLTIAKQDSADSYHVLQQLPTRRGARTMAVDPASGRVFVASPDLDPAPAPTPDQPHPRPVPRPDTFTVVVVGSK